MALPRLSRPSPAMRRLDALPWHAGLAIAAYGRKLGVRVNDPTLLRALPAHLPCGWKPAAAHTVERLYSVVAGGRRSHVLYLGAEPLARSRRLSEILAALQQDARLFVAEHARTRVFVHAAVVAWKGRAIVIPGKSMSGKTSLAAAFVRAGAAYYSDEYAVLDSRGRVHPYPKPLSIRNTTDYTQTDYPVEFFGGRAGTIPISIGMVLATEYRRGARWRPRPLSPGMGAMSLFANTVAAGARPERTLHVLRNAALHASVYKSSRDEADEVVRSVLVLFDRGSSLTQSELNI